MTDYATAEAEADAHLAGFTPGTAEFNAYVKARVRGYQSDAQTDPGYVKALQQDLADAKAKAAASHPDTYLQAIATAVDAVRPGAPREPGISRREQEIRELDESDRYWKRRAAELDKARAERLFAELDRPTEQPRAPFPF